MLMKSLNQRRGERISTDLKRSDKEKRFHNNFTKKLGFIKLHISNRYK